MLALGRVIKICSVVQHPTVFTRSQDCGLVVSAIKIPTPAGLQRDLRQWNCEDLNVRVFQGVHRGGPSWQRVCCRETYDMETGTLLARECFNQPPESHPTQPSLNALLHSQCLLVF